MYTEGIRNSSSHILWLVHTGWQDRSALYDLELHGNRVVLHCHNAWVFRIPDLSHDHEIITKYTILYFFFNLHFEYKFWIPKYLTIAMFTLVIHTGFEGLKWYSAHWYNWLINMHKSASIGMFEGKLSVLMSNFHLMIL